MARKRVKSNNETKAQFIATESIHDRILQHYNMTVHFNDTWRMFLKRMAIPVILMEILVVVRAERLIWSDTTAFAVNSVLTALATAGFINRIHNPILCFKIAFTLSIMHLIWYMYEIFTSNFRKEVAQNHLPFGAFYFTISWIADRYMMRSISLAEKANEEMQMLLKQKTH
ncbi:unnamed protein product [Albugo candida]|uniref:Uncharacterized protein n=1 Tax=Albugo candida TaxID=65357 RepID=A0A024GGH8_9STRA|nr:unnamed protein product [Albugo candida]|eukprot:CCI45420.1 unnamed protein product [Albugo candida]